MTMASSATLRRLPLVLATYKGVGGTAYASTIIVELGNITKQ